MIPEGPAVILGSGDLGLIMAAHLAEAVDGVMRQVPEMLNALGFRQHYVKSRICCSDGSRSGACAEDI